MHNPNNEFSHRTENNFGKNLNHHGVQLRPNLAMEEDDDSGFSSPPLWKNSPSLSPNKSPSSQPLLHNQNYRAFSPNSRAQAIARGQWELMEMVKNMPESSYELSLKDLVEHHQIQSRDPDLQERLNSRERNQGTPGGLHQRGKKNEKIIRKGSFDNSGLFLKMGFPIWNSKSKKTNKKSGVNNSSGKVSPKPDGLTDKELWMKRFAGSTDSDSSRSRTGSSGSSGSTTSGSHGSGRSCSPRKRNGLLHSCFPCFHSRRKQT